MPRSCLQLLVIDWEHTKAHEGSLLYDLNVACSIVRSSQRYDIFTSHHMWKCR